ncbi:hypothetical protein GEMRC1_004606 [Eukaryota sp. GEM-RC1]
MSSSDDDLPDIVPFDVLATEIRKISFNNPLISIVDGAARDRICILVDHNETNSKVQDDIISICSNHSASLFLSLNYHATFMNDIFTHNWSKSPSSSWISHISLIISTLFTSPNHNHAIVLYSYCPTKNTASFAVPLVHITPSLFSFHTDYCCFQFLLFCYRFIKRKRNDGVPYFVSLFNIIEDCKSCLLEDLVFNEEMSESFKIFVRFFNLLLAISFDKIMKIFNNVTFLMLIMIFFSNSCNVDYLNSNLKYKNQFFKYLSRLSTIPINQMESITGPDLCNLSSFLRLIGCKTHLLVISDFLDLLSSDSFPDVSISYSLETSNVPTFESKSSISFVTFPSDLQDCDDVTRLCRLSLIATVSRNRELVGRLTDIILAEVYCSFDLVDDLCPTLLIPVKYSKSHAFIVDPNQFDFDPFSSSILNPRFAACTLPFSCTTFVSRYSSVKVL